MTWTGRYRHFLMSSTAYLLQRRWFQWPRNADGSYRLSIDRWADSFKGKVIGKGAISWSNWP